MKSIPRSRVHIHSRRKTGGERSLVHRPIAGNPPFSITSNLPLTAAERRRIDARVAAQQGFPKQIRNQTIGFVRPKTVRGPKRIRVSIEGEGIPVSKGKPIFQPTAIHFGVDARGRPSVSARMMPSNYELNVRLRQELGNENPQLVQTVKRLKLQYEYIQKTRKGSLVIPPNIPMTAGQMPLVFLGKYLVLTLRSPHVRAYPGFFHSPGGVPFHPVPRRASLSLYKGNVKGEIESEMGVSQKKLRLGKPMGVHLTFEHAGMGFNLIQPVTIRTSDPIGFVRKQFRLANPSKPEEGYLLRKAAKEGWETTHFALVPNSPAELQRFYNSNKEKMTPVLRFAFQQLIGKTE
ncbi:MAG: hypothetical protein AABW68_00725 [archaeon]